MQDQINYEDQSKVCMVDHQSGFGFHDFQDPIENYLEEFISSKFSQLFDCQYEHPFFDEMMIDFQVFILLKHSQEIQLVT